MACGCVTTPGADNCPDQFIPPQPPAGDCSNPFITGALRGMRAQLPRLGDDGGRDICPPSDSVTVVLPGSAADSYLVTLQIRGAAEFNMYTGGSWEQGKINIGGVSDGNNQFDIACPDIAYAAHINGYEVVGPIPSPNIAQWDYLLELTVPGDATIILSATSPETELSNQTFQTVPPIGVPPYPTWFDGQFFQVDCLTAVKL